MTYESVLQTVSDILQLNNGPVKDLYTIEGKKVWNMSLVQICFLISYPFRDRDVYLR